MNDRLPQLQPISTNLCPNARPRAVFEFSSCDLYALTTWGYCGECWAEDRVPVEWQRNVNDTIARALA